MTIPSRCHTGENYGLITPRGAIILERSVDTKLVESMWAQLEGGANIGELLQTLTGAFTSGLASIPPFAIALLENETAHVAVRGDMMVNFEGSAGSISGRGVMTWSERLVEKTPWLSVGSADNGSAPLVLPVRSGVVLVSRVEVGQARETSDGADDSEHDRSGELDESSIFSGDDGDTAQPEAPAGGFDAVVAEETAQPAEGEDGDKWADLGDKTLGGEYELEETGGEQETDGEPESDGAQPQEPAEAVATPEPTEPEAPVEPEVQAPPAPPEAAGDHDGRTVSSELLSKLRGRGKVDTGALPASAPGMVNARACENGHVNPPYRETCRECSAPTGGQIEQLPAPSLGKMQVSTGAIVDLTDPVVVGRAPRAARVRGTRLPQLVAVPSPEQEISRNHLEVRLDGWSVLAVDLGSNNGTALIREGQERRPLPEGIPTELSEGDILDLGENVTLTFKDMN